MINNDDPLGLNNNTYRGVDSEDPLGLSSGTFRPSPPKEEEKSSLLRRGIADPLVGLAKGAIVGIPEAGYGLANLATGGLVGRGAEALNEATGAGTPASGFKMANEAFTSLLSPETQAAQKKVAEAQGFLPTVGEYFKNPSTIAQVIAENVPGVLAMRGIGKGALGLLGKPVLTGEKLATALDAVGGASVKEGVLTAATKEGEALLAKNAARAATGAAIGEGVYSAGQNITQAMEESGTDIMAPKSLLYNAAAGMVTGIISKLSGTLANKLGFPDIDVMMQGVTKGDFSKPIGVVKALLASAITEGLFEELPQSAQEMYFQNLSMGKADPWEGVAEAAASGLVAGAFMGLGGATGAALRSHIDPANRKIEGDINKLAEEIKGQKDFFGTDDDLDVSPIVNDVQLNALTQQFDVFANNGLYYYADKANPKNSGVVNPAEMGEEDLRQYQLMAQATAKSTNLLDRAQKGDLEAQKTLEASGVDWKPPSRMDAVREDYRASMGDKYNKSDEELGHIDRINQLDFALNHPSVIEREFAKLSKKKQTALPGKTVGEKLESYRKELEAERIDRFNKIQEGQIRQEAQYQPPASGKKVILKDEQGATLPDNASAAPDERNNITPVKLPTGEKVRAKYHIIDSSRVQPSHDVYGRYNENNEFDVQGRNRSDTGSSQQIVNISNSPDAMEMGESYLVGSGAPMGLFGQKTTINPVTGQPERNFSIINGTARGAGIKLAYEMDENKRVNKGGYYDGAPLYGEQYKQSLSEIAHKFGYTPEEVMAMKSPVLVREILTPVDTLEFSRVANVGVQAQRSAVEIGREDAQSMTSDMAHQFALNSDGSLNVEKSKEGIASFRNIMSERGEINQDAYFTDGKPNETFMKRVLTAMFINAFKDERLASHVADETNKTMNSVVRTLATVSDEFMQLQDIAKDLPTNPTNDVVEAVKLVRQAVNKKVSVVMAVNQLGLLSNYSQEVKELALAFDELSGDRRLLRRVLTNLANFARIEATALSQPGLFLGDRAVLAKSKSEMVTDALKSAGVSIAINKVGMLDVVRFEPVAVDEDTEASARKAENEVGAFRYASLPRPPLPAEMGQWIRDWKSFRDAKAKNNIIKHNQRYIYRLAHKYTKYFPDRFDALQDLAVEGAIGFDEALEKYDPTYKTAFLTYAGWKALARMQDYVQKNMKDVAEGKDVASRKYFRSLPGVMRELWKTVNFATQDSERAMLLDAAKSLGIGDEQLARLRGRDESLSPVEKEEGEDEGVGNRAALTAAQLLPAGETPESVMVGNEIKQLAGNVGAALSELTEQERYIVTNSIMADDPLTQTEIGMKFGITKQRVGQIETAALAKLKNKLAPIIKEGPYEGPRTDGKNRTGRRSSSLAEARKGFDRELATEERTILAKSDKFDPQLVEKVRAEGRVTKFLKLIGINRKGATLKSVQQAYNDTLKMINRTIPVNDATRPILLQLQRRQVWDKSLYTTDLFDKDNWEYVDVKQGKDEVLKTHRTADLHMLKKLVDGGLITKQALLDTLNAVPRYNMFMDATKVTPINLDRGGWRTMTEEEEAALVAELEDVTANAEYPTTYRVGSKDVPLTPLKGYLHNVTEEKLRKEYDHFLVTGLEKTLEIDEKRYNDRAYVEAFELGRQYGIDVVPLKTNDFLNAALLKYKDGGKTIFLAQYGDKAIHFTGHELSEAGIKGPRGEDNLQTRLRVNPDSTAFGNYHAALTLIRGGETTVEHALKEMAADLQGGLLVNHDVVLHDALYHGQQVDYIVPPNRTAVRELQGSTPSFSGEAEAAKALIAEHNTTPMTFQQAVDEYQRVTGASFPYPALIPLLTKMGTQVVYNKSPRTYFDKDSNTIFIGSLIGSEDTEASAKQPSLPGMENVKSRAPQRHAVMKGQATLEGVEPAKRKSHTTVAPQSKIYPNVMQTALDLTQEDTTKVPPIQVVGQSKEGYMDILYEGKRLYHERIDAIHHGYINALLNRNNFAKAGEVIREKRDPDYVAPTVLTDEQRRKSDEARKEARKSLFGETDTEASAKYGKSPEGIVQPELPGMEKKKFPILPPTKYNSKIYNERQIQSSLNFEAPVEPEDTEASASAWHGGHALKGERLSTKYVRTGTGGMMQGHGLYFADLKAVAEYYKNLVKSRGVADMYSDLVKGPGVLYKVTLAPDEDEYLLWDEPFEMQSAKVKKILNSIGYENDSPETGEEIYRQLQRVAEYRWYWSADEQYRNIEPDEAASKYLHSLGIRGNKYLDNVSREQQQNIIKNGVEPTRDKTYNYVIFNEDDVSIEDTEASLRPSKDRNSSELLGQALAIAGTEATIHNTLKMTSNLKYNSQHGFVNKGMLSVSLRNDLKSLYDSLREFRSLPASEGWDEAKKIYDRIGIEGIESLPKYAFHSRAFAAWLNSIPDFYQRRNAEYYETLERAHPSLWTKYKNIMLRMLGRTEKVERTKLDAIRDIMDKWVDVDLAQELSQYTQEIETDKAKRYPKLMDYIRATNTPYPFGKIFEYTEEFMKSLPESEREPSYVGLKVKPFKIGKKFLYEPIDMKNYVINRRKQEYQDKVIALKGNLPSSVMLSGGVKIGTKGLADEFTKVPVVNRGTVNWVSLRKRQIAQHKKVIKMSPEARARYLRAYEVRNFGKGWERESLYKGYTSRMMIWLSANNLGKRYYEISNKISRQLEEERTLTQAERFAAENRPESKTQRITRDASGIVLQRGITWKMPEARTTETGLRMIDKAGVDQAIPAEMEEAAKSSFAAAQNLMRGPVLKQENLKKQRRMNRKRSKGPSGLAATLYQVVAKKETIPYTASNTYSVTKNGKPIGKVTMEPYGEVGLDGQKHQVMMVHSWNIDTLKATRSTISRIFVDNPNISLIAMTGVNNEVANYMVLAGARLSYTDDGRIVYITRDMRNERITRESAPRHETATWLSTEQMNELDSWNAASEAQAKQAAIDRQVQQRELWLRRADEMGIEKDLGENQRIAKAGEIYNAQRKETILGLRGDDFWLREADKQGVDKNIPAEERIKEAQRDYVEHEPVQPGMFGGKDVPLSDLKTRKQRGARTAKPRMQNRSLFDTEASLRGAEEDTEASLRSALYSIADHIPIKLPRSSAVQDLLRGGLKAVPTEEVDKFEKVAEEYGGMNNRLTRKIFSLPHANAKKHLDWDTIFTWAMRLLDNKQVLEHEWLRKANIAINRRLYLKKAGYTNEQMAELDDKLGTLLFLGDERLRDKAVRLERQIKEMEGNTLMFNEDDVAPYRERLERMTKTNGYSYTEAVEQGVKDDDGNIIKLKDDKEYAIYLAMTTTVRDVFETQLNFLTENALGQHKNKAWFKLLSLALGEPVSNETLGTIAGGLKTAVSNRSKITVELKNLFERINKQYDIQESLELGTLREAIARTRNELDILENTKQTEAAAAKRREVEKLEQELIGVTKQEEADVMKRYTKIAETSRQELEELRTYISAVTGITNEKDVEKLTREMFKAYQMTRPLMKRISDMRAEVNQWVGFFPRIRHDGKWKMSLYELYRDEKSGTTKRKEVFADFFTTDDEFSEVYGRAMDSFGENGIFSEKYVTEYTPNKTETGPMYGDTTPSDIKLQKVLENAIGGLNVEGKFFDDKGNPVDLRKDILDESFRAVSEQLLNRGASRHRIHRKQKVGQRSIKGYNQTEFDKVFLNYVTSMAGSLSKQQATMEAMTILNDLKDKSLWPEIKDYVSSMLRSDTKADRVSGKLRSFAFLWYLGLMVKSGFVNSTQPYIVGLPLLTNWMQAHGMKGLRSYPTQMKATGDIARNFFALVRKDPSEWGKLEGLTDMEQNYLKEGLITGKMAAQQVRYIKGAATGWGKLKNDVFDVFAAPFAMVEIFNRLCSGLAMYRVAEEYHGKHLGKEEDRESIFEKAVDDANRFVNDVHYPIGRHNRPALMQKGDALGATAETFYVFRTFTHNFLLGQFNLLRSGITGLKSDDKATRIKASQDLLAVVHTMALMGLFGGLLGLPFFKDLFDWWEKEYGESPKLWLRETLNGLGGNTLETLGMNGLPALLGGNISGSLAIGVPFISDKNELDSVFGVWGGLKEKAKRSGEAFVRGDIYRGVANLSPEFLRGPIVALTESSFGENLGGRGVVTTASGMPVYGSDGQPLRMTAGESAFKSLGFQPTRISKEREVEWSVKNTVTWANEEKRKLTESYRIDRLQKDSGALKNLMNGIKELNAEIRERKIPTPMAKVSTVIKNSKQKKTKQQIREIRARDAILQQ